MINFHKIKKSLSGGSFDHEKFSKMNPAEQAEYFESFVRGEMCKLWNQLTYSFIVLSVTGWWQYIVAIQYVRWNFS